MHKNKICQLFVTLLLPLLLGGCTEFARIQKSTDTSLKYSYAKKYYNEKKYSKAAQLLEEVVPVYNGTSEGAQSLYLLADSYYRSKRQIAAADYFKRYYTVYPSGDMAQEARFKAGYGLYTASPDVRLDQGETFEAIKELQSYLEIYPEAPNSEEARRLLFELQDKLAYKEYLSAKLYANMGIYLGNNYRAAVITANEALKAYPYTRYREDLSFLVLQATYDEAKNSVVGKLQTRFRDVIDQYYAYINQYPNGKYLAKAQQIYETVSKMIDKNA